MSVFPQTSTHATSVSTLSSSIIDMSPRKVASKELSEARIHEPVEVTRPIIPI